MMQIEWNTQNCKLFTSTRLIRWWKFPFSAIAKASSSPCFWNRETSKKGSKKSFPSRLKVFPPRAVDFCCSHGWITLQASEARLPSQVEPTSNKRPLRGWLDDVRLIRKAAEDTDRSPHHQDKHSGKFPIKSAPFWEFSFCLSRIFVEVKSGGKVNQSHRKWCPRNSYIEQAQGLSWRTLTDYLPSPSSKARHIKATWVTWRKSNFSSWISTKRSKSLIKTASWAATVAEAEGWSWGMWRDY